MQKIKLIASVDNNYGIGYENQLLFRNPVDMKMFKDRTTNNIVVMGRKTFESIGKPLPNRVNIVLSSDENYRPENVTVVSSIADVIPETKKYPDKDVFIIGGSTIYEQFIKHADEIILTHLGISAQNVDAYFPVKLMDDYVRARSLYINPNTIVRTYVRKTIR